MEAAEVNPEAAAGPRGRSGWRSAAGAGSKAGSKGRSWAWVRAYLNSSSATFTSEKLSSPREALTTGKCSPRLDKGGISDSAISKNKDLLLKEKQSRTQREQIKRYLITNTIILNFESKLTYRRVG